MKKVLLALVLILSIMMVMACKSAPKAEAKSTLEQIYGKFKNDINVEGAKSYTVVEEDKLTSIANKNYGNGYYFPLILATSDVVKNPDKIVPGMVLTIPDLDKNLNNAKTKKRVKELLLEVAKDYDAGEDLYKISDGLKKLAETL